LLTFRNRNSETSQLPFIPDSRITCEQLKDTKWHVKDPLTMERRDNIVKSHYNEAQIEGAGVSVICDLCISMDSIVRNR
jgi:hypothetical protein